MIALPAALKKRLAAHGFESNDDYGFVLRCLFDNPPAALCCLHVAGSMGRRKTAFAQALMPALGFQRALYFDFSRPPPTPDVTPYRLDADADAPATGAKTKVLSAFERIMIESCALSEAAKTALVLDQLQLADFSEQKALGEFLGSQEWAPDNTEAVRAHAKNLLLILISEQPLYHALQKQSFRIYTDPDPQRFAFVPQDFDLSPNANALFTALRALFETLALGPTASEMQLLLHDLEQRVRSKLQLKLALLGRLEFADRSQLDQEHAEPLLDQVMSALNLLLGVEEA
jgi:hypothetical protein